jgi:flagellin
MTLRINNNVSANIAHRNLTQNSEAMGKSLERLSSGLKINRGADGPASLVISEYMRAQVSGLEQATRNNEAAVTMVQTAEGALNEVGRLLVDIRQQAIAASNEGTNDEAMREASQQEIENALMAIDRIADNTQFARKKLLNGENSTLTFQVGANAGQTTSVELPSVASQNLGFNVTIQRENGRMVGKTVESVSNGSGFASLADIDVTSTGGAQDSIGMVDAAIQQIATIRGELGAFQKNTLESNLTSLRVAQENLTAAESVIRDTDMASEMATFTRNQIMTQSAMAQLAQANVMPQNVMRLINA